MFRAPTTRTRFPPTRARFVRRAVANPMSGEPGHHLQAPAGHAGSAGELYKTYVDWSVSALHLVLTSHFYSYIS